MKPPSFDEPFDPQAHLDGCPNQVKSVGLFFNDVLSSLRGSKPRSPRLQQLAAKRYVAFLKYPQREFLELVSLVAAEVHPHVALGEAIRRIGRSNYTTFVDTMLGRTIFGVAGRDVHSILHLGPRALMAVMTDSDGLVTAERNNHIWRYTFSNYPAFIDTYCVGVLEGVLDHCGVRGTVRVTPEILFDGVVEITLDGSTSNR